jgi:hypothetical protein
METAVAFLIFNRPECTQRVFEAIRQAKPPILLVIADGPRTPDEAKECEKVRAIIDGVDWPCNILKNYSDRNMGCKDRVASGLDWVFSNVERAIILEDDCLPHPSFFQYCEDLLEQYKDDERIMTICGANRLGKWKEQQQSYHFSYYGGCWGWASWKRAWSHYDVEVKLWSSPEVRARIKDLIGDQRRHSIQAKRFESAYSGKVNTWDIQWFFTRISQSGLSIVPSVNLISNIGFGAGATHTKNSSSQEADRPVFPISFPLRSPDVVIVDREFDNQVFDKFKAGQNVIKKAFLKVANQFH